MLDQHTSTELKVAILRSGLKHYQVADRIGLNEVAFSKVLRGRQALSNEKLQTLQELLGLNLVRSASAETVDASA